MLEPAFPSPRRGAVAVVVRDARFLVIRRSRHVSAPRKFCFPGGKIEQGESEEVALRRELQEELGCEVVPQRCVWRSETSWGVQLAWWLASIGPETDLTPHPDEVESFHWLTGDEMRALGELLESNRRFLDALEEGVFSLE